MAAEVGQAAPDFTLYDTDRTLRSLSEFRGKNVVLAFFPGAFTGACTNEACTLRDAVDEFNSMNAQVVGITVDPPFSQKAWADANNVNYPFLSDFTRATVNAYDVALPNLAGMEGYVAANRAVIIVDGEGIIRYRWIAPTPPTEPDYDEVRAAVGQLA
jgi:peroxiredoxin